MMEAGRLNKRITLLRFVPEPSDTRQKTKGSYVPAFTVWAEVLCTQSTIATDGGAIVYETVYKFNVRYRDDILPNMRIQYNGKTFSLTGAPVDWKKSRNGITLLAKEVQ